MAANSSKFNKSKNAVKKATKNQLPNAVKVGVRIQPIRVPKGKTNKTSANQGTTASKKKITKAPASKQKKKFSLDQYFNNNAGPFGGFRGITTTGKRPY